MKALIIYAHPNPMSFTKAILDHFIKGIREAGHQSTKICTMKLSDSGFSNHCSEADALVHLIKESKKSCATNDLQQNTVAGH